MFSSKIDVLLYWIGFSENNSWTDVPWWMFSVEISDADPKTAG